MSRPLNTTLFGFGAIAAGLAEDLRLGAKVRYATHAQALHDHPDFAWNAVVDPSPKARTAATTAWAVPTAVDHVGALSSSYETEVAVIATPPDQRAGIVDALPNLRAVLVEKPLGLTVSQGDEFVHTCERRGIHLQVNLSRRADEFHQTLAAGGLEESIGRPQAVSCIYGNGLRNNAVHLVDHLRMLFGEVASAQATVGPELAGTGPFPYGFQCPFVLRLRTGLVAAFHPVDFGHFRENSIDVWGERGRLCIIQEGTLVARYPVLENRSKTGAREIASDQPSFATPGFSMALYRMYSNLAAAVRSEEALWSPGESALRTEMVLEAILDSADRGGIPVELPAVVNGS